MEEKNVFARCSNDLSNARILLRIKWLNKNMYILTSEKSNYDSHKSSRNLSHYITARLCNSVICQISPFPYKLAFNSKFRI